MPSAPTITSMGILKIFAITGSSPGFPTWAYGKKKFVDYYTATNPNLK
jgi:hypothetical protein